MSNMFSYNQKVIQNYVDQPQCLQRSHIFIRKSSCFILAFKKLYATLYRKVCIPSREI